MNFREVNDQELLNITNPNINKGSIPLKAVEEVKRRGLKKFVNRTLNSFDFDKEGNFLNQTIDFRGFKFNELFRRYECVSVGFGTFKPHTEDKPTAKELKLFKNEILTFGSCVNFSVNEGSENLYLNIEVYLSKEVSEKEEVYTSLFLEFYTKENHEGLKQIINSLVSQI